MNKEQEPGVVRLTSDDYEALQLVKKKIRAVLLREVDEAGAFRFALGCATTFLIQAQALGLSKDEDEIAPGP